METPKKTPSKASLLAFLLLTGLITAGWLFLINEETSSLISKDQQRVLIVMLSFGLGGGAYHGFLRSIGNFKAWRANRKVRK